MTSAQPGSGGMLDRLMGGVSAAGQRVADMELDKKLSPLVDNSKQAAKTGLGAVAHVSGQARELISQKELWDEQHALVESMIEVVSLQQALIEDLRARVSVLEDR